MKNAQNADTLRHIIQNAVSVYDFKPEMDKIFSTMPKLDKASVEVGQFVRCVASSEAGTMTSNPVEVK